MRSAARAIRLRRLSLALVAALGLAVAACGSDDDDSATSQPPAAADTTAPASDATSTPAAPGTTGAAAPDTTVDTTGAPVAVSDETIRVAMGNDTGGTDPVNPTAGPPSNPIRKYTVETLFMTVDGEIRPHLAESYTLSDDKLTYTIELRPGIVFHDGTPLDAEAVKWSLDRTKDPQFTGVSVNFLRPIESVTVIDDLTLEIKAVAPTPDMPGVLSTMGAAILSPTGVDTDGNSWEAYDHPIGTGPYKFVERVPDERYVFERNDDYWGDLPYYKSVEWLIVPEAATRESMVLAGEADVAAAPPLADIPALAANPDLQVIAEPTARLILIFLNTQDPAFSDVRVRQAVNLAVDKQAIIDSLLAGQGAPAGGPIASTLNPTCDLDEPWPYDPEQASQLLEEAGASDLSLTLRTPRGRYLQDAEAAEAVANYLREVGIDVEVQVLEGAQWLEATNAPIETAGPGFTLTGLLTPYPDAGRALSNLLPAAMPPNGVNGSFLDSPAVTESYAAANGNYENPARAEAFCETAKAAWDEVPMLYLWNQFYPVVASKSVANVVVEFDEKIDVIGAYPAD